MDVHDLQTGGLQTFRDLRTARIDRDTIFSDHDIDCGARGDEGCDLVHHARDAASHQRADDDRQGSVGRRVRMSADGAADDSVAADKHVDVEVDIDLKSREDHYVEEMDGGTGLVRAGIFIGGDFLVETVVLEGFRRDLVEGLHIDQAVDETLLVQSDHVRRDAAEGEAAVHSLLDHLLADVLHRGEGRSAGSGLDGETFLEVAAVDNHLRRFLGEKDVARVLGVADGSRRDLG